MYPSDKVTITGPVNVIEIDGQAEDYQKRLSGFAQYMRKRRGTHSTGFI